MIVFKKQSGFALPLAILIVVVLIVGGAVGYYSYKTSQELEEIGKGLKMVKPEQIIDETADWNIYNNYIFGYKIQYPDNIFTEVPSSFLDKISISFHIAEQTGVTIEIGQNPERLSAIDWIEQTPDDVSFFIEKYKDTIEMIDINEKKCVRVFSITQLQGLPMDQWVHTIIPFETRMVVISKVEKDKSYNLEQIYRQMSHTFDFIDETLEKILPAKAFIRDKLELDVDQDKEKEALVLYVLNKEIEKDEAIWCGNISGEKLKGDFYLSLIDQNRLQSQVKLFPYWFENGGDYKNKKLIVPQDLNGDGKELEFTFDAYGSCNGNLREIIGYSLKEQKLKRFQFYYEEGKINETIFVSDLPGPGLEYKQGFLIQKFYSNAPPVGTHYNYYAWNSQEERFDFVRKTVEE